MARVRVRVRDPITRRGPSCAQIGAVWSPSSQATFLHSYIPTFLHPYIPTFLHSYIPAQVGAVWSPFSQAGKNDLSVVDLLNHASGLGGAVPASTRLADLADLEQMVGHVAEAPMDMCMCMYMYSQVHMHIYDGQVGHVAEAPMDAESAAEARGGQAAHEGLPWGW